jgi:hypothetical protein
MRSYREFWLWLGAALLTVTAAFVGVSLAYFTKEASFSPYTNRDTLVALIAFVAAFACFACAILGFVFPPWAGAKFPDIYFDIYSRGEFTTTRTLPLGMEVPANLVLFKVRITNLEREQNVSLTIAPYFKLVPGSAGRLGEAYATAVDWQLDPNLQLRPIEMPIQIAPGTTVAGDLVYELRTYGLGKLAEPERVRVSLFDHISNRTMEIRMTASIGRFRRDDMARCRGGPEILRPEYEFKQSPAPPA